MTRPLFPDIVVNGVTLDADDIAAEAQNHPAPRGKPGLAWRRAARALAVRRLLLDAAHAREIDEAPRELAPGKFETPQDARIRALLEQVVVPEPVSEPALRARYDRDPGAFRAPSLYEAAHILFAAPPDDTEARKKAHDRARGILEILRRDPGRFGEIARAESDCTSRDAGGVLGQLASGDTVPEFEAALRSAPLSEINGTPVETRYGIHVLRLDARAEGAVLPFEAVRPRLAEAAEKAAWAKAAHGYVTALLEGADIRGMDLLNAA